MATIKASNIAETYYDKVQKDITDLYKKYFDMMIKFLFDGEISLMEQFLCILTLTNIAH